MKSQRGKNRSAVTGTGTGTAGRNAAGKSCRTWANAAYPGIVSACLWNESTALQFLMFPPPHNTFPVKCNGKLLL